MDSKDPFRNILEYILQKENQVYWCQPSQWFVADES